MLEIELQYTINILLGQQKNIFQIARELGFHRGNILLKIFYHPGLFTLVFAPLHQNIFLNLLKDLQSFQLKIPLSLNNYK